MGKIDKTFLYIVTLTLVGTGVTTILLRQNRSKKGDVMSNANYIADTLKEKSVLSEDSINSEIETLLKESKKRTSYDMVRIARPTQEQMDMPQRGDSKLK